MKQRLYEPLRSPLDVPYRPDDAAELAENPPRFTWMPGRLEESVYALQWSETPEFEPEKTRTVWTPLNMYTPDAPFAPGTYYWRYAMRTDGGGGPAGARRGPELMQAEGEADARELERAELTTWSRVRRFTVADGLPETPLPPRRDRYKSAKLGRPRLWLTADGLERFRETVREKPEDSGYTEFLERSVRPWLNREPIAEPEPYPGHKRVPHLWRKMYMDCQELLYGVRHLSVAGAVSRNGEWTSRAKEWLLAAASWDVDGPTSRDYNDEAAFRVAAALAWGYDWLHGELGEKERALVREALFRRTEQVAAHAIERSKIHHAPFDSHAVRSLSSVLVPCSIALFDEVPEARDWLDYAVEYFSAMYTPWGGADGGWAEGGQYWTTGMAFVTEAINLLRKFCGIDFYARPFFQKTGDFALYCFTPGTSRASFGDQSNLGEPPGLKTAFNIRQFAGVTGNPWYQWYYEQVKAADKDPESKFYNYGWWDFPFDEMRHRYDFPAVAAEPPAGAERLKWFRDIGWVAMHDRMHDPDSHVMLLVKSSPYGSISHSHGDQNGFLLHAYGEPLAIESGYYVAFNTTMHRNWRRQTISTNSLLIDGIGQYAGVDARKCIEAAGCIEAAEEREYGRYVRADATRAYRETVPYLERFVREIHYMDDSYIVMVDSVDCKRPARVDWLLHALHRAELRPNRFRIAGARAVLDGQFVYVSSGEMELSQTDEFAGVDPAEIEGLPAQWHLRATTRPAASHRIVSLLAPMPANEPSYVSARVDDQGHAAVQLYFTRNGITRHLEVAKAY
ncbi:DUF4962 domain-containing protein [Paenibacillus thermoaerophilus]|uniref:DUF4962 domain-containing protein n=1 Tax=Paenibacillus thermoaerophilus TaxID=1215385 RepID=A0ABW2V0H3_9BACL|nr:DUF4962 domain-containing protein [Paenibacillus thermoaerophilus]TMV11028.1 DUF4962 domain-containing protein [Paenibacillus thermoaerophilus]